MTGYAALFLALIMTGLAAFSYFNTHLTLVIRRRKQPGGRNTRSNVYYLAAAALVGVAALDLLYLILDNHFEYAYVFGYSARDLPLAYKLSAFWAGQEGSFLLWLVFHVVFGLLISRRQSPPGAMAVYCLLQVVLLAILLAKSPFMMLAEPKPDGAGLNPLLQDPWMVIHPPVVFLGYAGLAVPFAYAMEGLMSSQRTWVNRALPWTLFSWSALGAGIFIGGFWAYKVLGWGGYWGWDPVENASLVPWLVCGGLIHLLLLARVRPAGVKPAYVAVIFTYVLVLYGTFLTRSGILSDFSTHSFADEGIGGLLAIFLLLTTLAAMTLLIIRWPGLPREELYPSVQSREFLLACTALVLGVTAALVLVGMSTPLFTMLVGRPQNVNTAFYNLTTLPLAAVLAALLAAAPLVRWGANPQTGKQHRWWLMAVPAGALAGSIGAGVHRPLVLAVIALAATALASHMVLAVRGRRISWPAGIAHTGIAVMLIGIVVSSTLDQTVSLHAAQGESLEAFATKITYLGTATSEDGRTIYQSFGLEGHGNTTLQAVTKLNREGRPAAHEPAIYRGIAGDLYITPVMLEDQNPVNELTLHKGEQAMAGALTVKFIDLVMNGRGGKEDIRVQAVLEITKDGTAKEVRPELIYHNGRINAVPLTVFEDYEIMLGAVNPNEKAVMIGWKSRPSAGAQQQLQVEISRKPLIILVWLGAALVTIGSGWAGWARLRASAAGQQAADNGKTVTARR